MNGRTQKYPRFLPWIEMTKHLAGYLDVEKKQILSAHRQDLTPSGSSMRSGQAKISDVQRGPLE